MLKLDRSSWTRVRFGDVVRNVNEYHDRSTGPVYPYVAGPHIDDGEIVVARYGSTSDPDFPPTFKRFFQPGDVLLHSRGFGKLAVVDRRGVTGEKLFVLRSIDPGTLDQRFLPWLLMGHRARDHMERNFTGSVNKFLNWRPMSEFEFDLPPLDQQRRIADLLWVLEGFVHAGSVLSASLEAAREALVTAELRRYSPAEFVPCSELLAAATVGIVIRPAQYYTSDADGVPALRSLNVLPGKFKMDDLVRFRPEAHQTLTKTTLREGDVIIVRTGRPGDAAVVDRAREGMNCIDMIIARTNARLDPHFLALLLNSSAGRALVLEKAAGTAQQHLNAGALKRVMLPVPPMERQREVLEELEAMDVAARRVAEALESARAVGNGAKTVFEGGEHELQ